MKLFDYLSFSDVLNMRLTCSTFYALSQCKEFYQRVQVSVTTLRSCLIPNFLHFVKNCAGYARLNIHNCHKMECLLPCIQSATDVSINMLQLKMLTENCHYVEKMKIVFGERFRIDADPETYLTCLQKLFRLNEIDIREISVNNQHLSWISYLIKYASNISKLSFKNMYLSIYASHDNTCNELFKETITNAKHVKDWSFTNINCGKELFVLPPSDISLTIRNSIYKNIDFKNASIIKFCLDARILYNNSTFNFRNLKVLEFYNVNLLYIRKDEFLCSNLEVLKLSETLHTQQFLCDFVPVFKFSLKELILEKLPSCINEHCVSIISNECLLLRKFTFKQCYRISDGVMEYLD